MVDFDEEKQNKHLEEMRKNEEEDVSRIFRAIEEELRTVKARFRPSKAKKFSL